MSYFLLNIDSEDKNKLNNLEHLLIFVANFIRNKQII